MSTRSSVEIGVLRESDILSEPSTHCGHLLDREAIKALKAVINLKRKVKENKGAPPAQVLRVLDDIPATVSAHLPAASNLTKMVQHQRLQDLPPAPRMTAELGTIPCKFRISKKVENFLLYDSHDDPPYNLQCERILVFATLENLRLLMKAHAWFLDGTFFFQ